MLKIIQVCLIFSATQTAFSINLGNLSKKPEFNKDNFEAFKHFEDDVKRLNNLEQNPIQLSLSLNTNLENSFEHNLIAPSPHNFDQYAQILSPGVRYTSTPVETYKVNEEVFEPKPIPQLMPSGNKPLILGSGSLGIVNLGHGKYALGSGSLGYSQPVAQEHLSNEWKATGGLHVVPPPQVGSSEAFDAAFENFNFEPFHRFFRKN